MVYRKGNVIRVRNGKQDYTIDVNSFIEKKLDSVQAWRFKGLGKVFYDIDFAGWQEVRLFLEDELNEWKKAVTNDTGVQNYLASKPELDVVTAQFYAKGVVEGDTIINNIHNERLKRWEKRRKDYYPLVMLDTVTKLIELWEKGRTLKSISIPKTIANI